MGRWTWGSSFQLGQERGTKAIVLPQFDARGQAAAASGCLCVAVGGGGRPGTAAPPVSCPWPRTCSPSRAGGSWEEPRPSRVLFSPLGLPCHARAGVLWASPCVRLLFPRLLQGESSQSTAVLGRPAPSSLLFPQPRSLGPPHLFLRALLQGGSRASARLPTC